MILAEGSNCWRIARADRAAFLIDGAAYFAALREALERAQREIIIVGWDVDSRARLFPRDPKQDRAPIELLPYLRHLLDSRPDLYVYLLSWDFSFIYMLERQRLPTLHFAKNGHPRLALQLDGRHPLLASHHQKIVTIDGRVAFVGGLDLTTARWDTPEHRAKEPRRVDPLGRPYAPFHDVQMIVDGEAARAVTDLATARWGAATGAAPSTLRADASPSAIASGADPWPPGVTPDLRDATVGVSRTQPTFDDRPAVNEVLKLTLDALASARRSVYIETQYLTSAAVGQAMERSLAAPDGPEIVVVMPREQSGWLEKSSMGILRARLLARLQGADRHGRLKVYYPIVPKLAAGCVNVHAKVLVVDDTLARVGSSNLSNRSMGLDSECDLAIDATAPGASPEIARGVAALRDRLLAEHLATDARTVSATIDQTGSLIAAVERLRGGPRTLAPLVIPPDAPELDAEDFNLALMDGFVADPERPAPDFVVDEIVPPEARQPAIRTVVGWAIAVAVVTALVAMWRFTPLREFLDVARLARLGRALAAQPAAPALVLTVYLVGGLLFFPISVLLTATAVVFSPPYALLYSLGGALASALLTYVLGRLIARYRPRWLERPTIERLRRTMTRRGILAVIAMRLLPVGNFSLINIVAGAMRIRLRDFLIGNTVGLLPGILLLTAFANRLVAMLHHPGVRSAGLLSAVLVVVIAVLFGLRRTIARVVRSSQERHD